MKTAAAILRHTGSPLEIEDLELPPLAPGQVLVELAYSGLCHTQLSEMRGLRGRDAYLPHTLGHEGSGVVRQIGDGVTKVIPDQPVVVSWIKGLGAEVPRCEYRSLQGAVNSGAVSTFLHWAVVSENRVTPLPAGVPLREAALLGCAIPTGAGIVLNTLRMGPGDSLAVWGAGGIGLCAIQAAAAVGVTTIIAVDVVAEKLRLASTFGATHTIDARDENVVEAVRQITAGRGADCTIEAAGRIDAAQAAVAAVRPGGGRVVLAGNPPAGQQLSIDPYELIRGKTLLGSWGGDTQPDRDIPRYAQLWQAGKLMLTEMITHTYPLDQINQGLNDLAEGRVGRAMIALAPGNTRAA